MTSTALGGRKWILAGLGAGVVSGVTLAIFAALSALDSGQPVTAIYVFLASTFGGSTLGDGPAAIPVGVLLLFLGTILWAYGYIYAARSKPQLLTRPLVSGAVFGPIAWLVMQIELVAVGRFSGDVYTINRDIFGFILFFGIPLAWTAARLMRER